MAQKRGQHYGNQANRTTELNRILENINTRLLELEDRVRVRKTRQTIRGDLTLKGKLTVNGEASDAEFCLKNDFPQIWDIQNVVATGRFTVRDTTNSKSPFKVFADSDNNLLRVGLTSDQVDITGNLQVVGYVKLWPRTDANRGSASTAGEGATIWNTDDDEINTSDGTNWILASTGLST